MEDRPLLRNKVLGKSLPLYLLGISREWSVLLEQFLVFLSLLFFPLSLYPWVEDQGIDT